MTPSHLVTLPPEESEKLYPIYRQYLVNEANLINARLTWLLTIQGFVFATYGLVVASQRPWVSWAVSVLRWLPVFGAAVSLVALASILAARFAADEVFNKWKNLPHSDAFKALMPEIRGGGHPWAHGLGLVAPWLIPLALCAIWVALFFLSLQPVPSEPGVNV